MVENLPPDHPPPKPIGSTDPGAFAPPASIPSARTAPDGNAPGSRIATMPPESDDDTEFEPIQPRAPGVVPKPPARTAAKPPPLPRPRPKEAAVAAPSAGREPAISPPPASTGPSASAENTAPSAVEIDE